MINFGISDQRLSFLWRVLRPILIGVCVLFLIVTVALGIFIWRLERSPVDVTSLVQYWQPAVLNMSDGQPPVGRIHWKKVLLSWSPRSQKLPSGATLQVGKIDLVQSDGRVVDHLEHVEAVLDLFALFRGHLAFRAIRIIDAHLALKRYNDGTILPDITGFPHSSNPSRKQSIGSFLDFSALRKINVTRFSVVMKDEDNSQTALSFQMPLLNIHYHPTLGWNGNVEGSFHWGNDTVPFYFNALPEGKGHTHLVFQIGEFVPARLAQWLPPNIGAEDLKRWQVPVSARAEGEVIPTKMGAQPLNLWANFTFGSGNILQSGHDPLLLQAGRARFSIKWQGKRPLQNMSLDQAKIELTLLDSKHHSTSIISSAHADIDDLLSPKKIDIDAHTHMPNFDFSTLNSVWPYGVIKGARLWMTTNMTEGHGDDLAIDAHLHSRSGLNDLDLTKMEGHLRGHALAVHWLRPMPPITGLEAYAHFLSPDVLKIDVQHGLMSDGGQGKINVPEGDIVLSGLMKKAQYGRIRLGLDGTLPSFLNILYHPRLHLSSLKDLEISNASGNVKSILSVGLPLNSSIDSNDIDLNATSQCQYIAFTSPDIGAIKRGVGELHVSQHDLFFQGNADIRNVPVKLSIMESFQKNEPGRILRQINAETWLNNAGLNSLGLSLPEKSMSGAAHVRAHYVQKGLGNAQRQGDVHVKVDLTPVSIALASWVKEKNIPSFLGAHFHLLGNRIQMLDELSASGPSLALSGNSVIRNGNIVGFNFDHVQVGRNEGSLYIRWPEEINNRYDTPYEVSIKAKTLDVSSWMESHDVTQKPQSQTQTINRKKNTYLLPSGQWHISLQGNRIFYNKDKFLSGVIAEASWANHMMCYGSIKISSPDPIKAQLLTLPGRNIRHQLDVDISNLGVWLERLGEYKNLDGGHVHLNGIFSSNTSQEKETVGWAVGLGAFKGRIDVQKMTILHPPIVLKASKVLSPLHWGEIGRDRFEGLKASATVSLNDRVLTLTDGQLNNEILGTTINGVINFRTRKLALKGMVSPFFKFNHATSIFGAEKGNGVLAVPYMLGGSLDTISLKFYPLSALLPGALRHILD